MKYNKTLIASAIIVALGATGCAANVPSNNNGNENGEKLSAAVNKSYGTMYDSKYDSKYTTKSNGYDKMGNAVYKTKTYRGMDDKAYKTYESNRLSNNVNATMNKVSNGVSGRLSNNVNKVTKTAGNQATATTNGAISNNVNIAPSVLGNQTNRAVLREGSTGLAHQYGTENTTAYDTNADLMDNGSGYGYNYDKFNYTPSNQVTKYDVNTNNNSQMSVYGTRNIAETKTVDTKMPVKLNRLPISTL